MIHRPWQRTRLKYLVEVNTAVLPEATDDDFEFVYIDIGNVSQGSMSAEGQPLLKFVDAPSRARRLANAGDSVVSTVRTYLRAVATVPLSDEILVFSTGFAVLSPQSGVHPRFLSWYLQGDEFVSRIEANSTGVSYPAITATNLVSLDLRIPSLNEQRAIADYLDRETARIDTLIEEQQRLIELFRERREAAVRHALLSGIDGASTKASGVELLREIPENWQMVPTRYLCTITTGSEDSGNATEAGDYPFYVRGREVLRMNHYSFDGEAVMTPGDGQGGTGKVFHYFDGKFEAHQRVYVFKDFEGVTGRFFFYFLSTFLRPVALAGSNTVTMESLRRPLLADFKVAVPPLEEQRRIVGYLDDKIAKIDQVMAETERFIELSRERRSALITAAVTGQIDVREVA